MKTLRIPHRLLVGDPDGLEIKTLALFHDPAFDDYYIPLDSYWATWLMLKNPQLKIVDIDPNLF